MFENSSPTLKRVLISNIQEDINTNVSSANVENTSPFNNSSNFLKPEGCSLCDVRRSVKQAVVRFNRDSPTKHSPLFLKLGSSRLRQDSKTF